MKKIDSLIHYLTIIKLPTVNVDNNLKLNKILLKELKMVFDINFFLFQLKVE
jgi:hypothetical protein